MKKFILAMMVSLIFSLHSHANQLDFQKLYESWAGSSLFSPDASLGKKMWDQKFYKGRSCSSCHTNNLNDSGLHVKTKKIIKPLSPTKNAKRLSSTKKINKWLKRNCKFTFNRECTLDEKINFIEYIKTY